MFRDFALHAKSLLATGRFCRAQKAAPAKEILRSLGVLQKTQNSVECCWFSLSKQWERRERKSSMFRDFALHAKSLRLPLREVLTREKPAFRGRRSNNGALAVKRSGTATAEYIATRLRGQAVKTSPFHGGNTGPNPVGVITYLHFLKKCGKFFIYGVIAKW